MSLTPSHKMLCAASAASLAAMSFLMPPAPVNASPMRPLDPATPCDSYTFPANFTLKQDNGIIVVISNPVGSTFSGTGASYSIPGKTQPTGGSASGGVAGGTNLDFTINWNSGPGAGFSNHYTGVINKNLTAQGMSTNNKGDQNVWASAPMALTCVAAPAPVQQQQPNNPPPANNLPTGNVVVTPNQGRQNLTFAVANNSSVPVKCTYDAKKTKGLLGPGDTNEAFPLAVGASKTLTFLEIPLGTTYHVVIECKGAQFQSDFVQDFTG
jgi:hypothetical protein